MLNPKEPSTFDYGLKEPYFNDTKLKTATCAINSESINTFSIT